MVGFEPQTSYIGLYGCMQNFIESPDVYQRRIYGTCIIGLCEVGKDVQYVLSMTRKCIMVKVRESQKPKRTKIW